MTTTLDPIAATKTIREEYDRLDTLVMGLVDLLGDVQKGDGGVKLPELRHATAQTLTRSLEAREGALDFLLTGRWPYDLPLTELGGLSMRTLRALARHDITKLSALEAAYLDGSIASLAGVGQKMLDEIDAAVEGWLSRTEGVVA